MGAVSRFQVCISCRIAIGLLVACFWVGFGVFCCFEWACFDFVVSGLGIVPYCGCWWVETVWGWYNIAF